MRTDSRAGIAFLAGRHILGKDAPKVFDVANNEHYDIAAVLEKKGVELLERNPPFGVARNFFELGTASYCYSTNNGPLYLNINGNSFKGYCTVSCSLFAGMASGNLVILYDYKAKKFFQYRLCFSTHAQAHKNTNPPVCGQLCNDCVVGKVR